MVIDPVCGMEVEEDKVNDKFSFNDVTYYFCSSECKEDFERSPEDFIGDDEGIGAEKP
jgi:YHS domain-containing protein